MPLPEFTRKLVETKLTKYCEQKIPPHVRHQLRLNYRFRGNQVTLFEERPVFDQPEKWGESVIAQFRFSPQERSGTVVTKVTNSR